MRIHTRALPKDILVEAIQHLATRYPATFFEDARLRRPLKSTILADLQEDDASAEILSGAEFYMQSWGYLGCLQVGVERVDLAGKKCGIVTEQEQSNAQKRLREEKEQVRKEKEALSKVTFMKPPSKPKTPKPDLSELPPLPEVSPVQAVELPDVQPLARLQKLSETAANLFHDTEDEALRSALTVATLKLLADETTRVITSLEGSSA
jgi:sRNA-binding protein